LRRGFLVVLAPNLLPQKSPKSPQLIAPGKVWRGGMMSQ
jgi:hypothetical protein